MAGAKARGQSRDSSRSAKRSFPSINAGAATVHRGPATKNLFNSQRLGAKRNLEFVAVLTHFSQYRGPVR
jgi:hypothetical protein